MSRPFFNWRIQDLETELAERRDDAEFLRAIIDELGFRSTDRASQLKARTTEALARTQGQSPPSSRAAETLARPSPPPREPVRPLAPEIPVERPPVPRVTNVPEAILDAWTALEALSPQSFRRPEELTAGDRQAIASLDRGCLPWEGEGEKARPKTRLFYQLVLGTVDLEKATARLLAVYADSRVDRPQMRGEAILAVVLLDREGRLVEAPAVSVSSFGWGAPRALTGNLSSLAGWRAAEKPLVEGLDEILRRAQEEEEDPPLDLATIQAGYEWLVASLGLAPELVTPPRFAIRSYEYFKNPDPPDPLLLNSFYLKDLTTARSRFAEGKGTPNLRLYLGCDVPATRHDLLENAAVLEAAVAPERIPPARWPGPGRHPLVLLQQAAVNLALQELGNTGILAVNGPIDEAGQALPQAAVGALLRSRRAVVVGDPVQIEPIVSLPDTLTQAICRYFGVDPDRYNAPNASAQTLADAATPYMAEFQGKHGSRTVGVPLLVHRRCAEPMFGISNAVAYERLMVQAKAAAPSRIGEILGPSAWIDVRGGAAEKWCHEEGEMVLSLLRRLAEAEIVPDLSIVTPFVIVADNLRKLLRESGILADWTEDPWRWTSERIGTVHTVQGREAEAVIFVLGAPAPEQTGARGWAGGRPNLLNVAVTRAKERLYVVENRSLWREAGLFRELDARL